MHGQMHPNQCQYLSLHREPDLIYNRDQVKMQMYLNNCNLYFSMIPVLEVFITNTAKGVGTGGLGG